MIRRYPKKYGKCLYNYSKEFLNKYISLKNDKEFLRRFNLFEKCINHRTGRAITKNSKTWKEIEKEFILRDFDNYSRCDYVYFGDMNINHEEELKEHEKVIEKNIIIQGKNDRINTVVDEINKLGSWNDYILFEGEKYGIPSVIKSIHKEYDCFGYIMSTTHNPSCRCVLFDEENTDIQCMGFGTFFKCIRCGKDVTDELLIYVEYISSD